MSEKVEVMNIISNHQPRLLLDWHQLTPKEKAEFDYLDSDDARISASFFRYRGIVYDAGEFMRIENSPVFHGWHGCAADSFFSGVLIRFCEYDRDRIIVGRYYS